MRNFCVLVGSMSDKPKLDESGLAKAFNEAEDVTWEAHAISAHRNLEELLEFLGANKFDGFVCGAGWSAALPGVVKGFLLGLDPAPVVGVPLSSEAFPDARDAFISIDRLPPGIDVVVAGQDVDAGVEYLYDAEGFDWAAQYLLGYQLLSIEEAKEACEAAAAKIKRPTFDLHLEMID